MATDGKDHPHLALNLKESGPWRQEQARRQHAQYAVSQLQRFGKALDAVNACWQCAQPGSLGR